MVMLPIVKEGDIMLGLDVFHEMLPLLPFPVLPHAVGATIFWCADGDDLSQNVFVNGKRVAKRGHDIGGGSITDIGQAMIPHVPVPPLPNAALLWIIPFASSKVMLGAGSVMVNGEPIAAHSDLIMLLLNCSEPLSLPVGHLICFSDVFVDVSAADILTATRHLIVDMGISLISGIIAKKLTKLIGGTATQEVTQSVSRTVTKKTLTSIEMDLGGALASKAFIASFREASTLEINRASRVFVQMFGKLWTTTIVQESSSVLLVHAEREVFTILTQKYGQKLAREFSQEFWESTLRTTVTRELSEVAASVTEKIFEKLIDLSLSALHKFLETLLEGEPPPPPPGTLLVT